MAAALPYQVTHAQALEAYRQGQFRQAADYYWTAFHQATAVSKWAEERYTIFCHYAHILKVHNLVVSDQDLRNLQRMVRNDPNEVILYRFCAGVVLGVLYEIRQDRETAADYYRQTMALTIESATEVELCRTVIIWDEHNTEQQGRPAESLIVREIINGIRMSCASYLSVLEDRSTYTATTSTRDIKYRSDGMVLIGDNITSSQSANASATNSTEEMVAALPYQVTRAQADEAFRQGQFRQAADYYWTAFRQAAAVSRLADDRFAIFCHYVSILKEHNLVLSDQDLRNLKRRVWNDPNELVLYRVYAGIVLAVLYEMRQDRETAADYFRRTMALTNDPATEVELCRTVINQGRPAGSPIVREIVNRIRQDCADCLFYFEDRSRYTTTTTSTREISDRPDGTPYDFEVAHTSIDDDELMRRSVVGGNECDFCHKTLAELGVATLNCCAACKLAYYCCQACQRAAWKAGHKEACRKPDERRAGDVMRLVRLEVRPDLNDRLVTLLRAEPNDRWQVRLVHFDRPVMSVSAAKLAHLRPAK